LHKERFTDYIKESEFSKKRYRYLTLVEASKFENGKGKMKHLKTLHESFIDKARRPMIFGKLPIAPLSSGAAIIPVDRWETVESPKRMRKTYKFISNELRNAFVESIFDYEKKVGHNAKITVEEDKVTLDVYTKDVDQITELDREYAEYADVLFKDIVYSVAIENEF